MRKLHYYASLIALPFVFVSCSSDDGVTPLQSDESDITFTTAVEATGSRADTVGLSELAASGFWVTAVKADKVSYPWGSTGRLKFSSTDNGSTFNPEVPSGALFDTKWPTGQHLYFFATNADPDSCAMTNQFSVSGVSSLVVRIQPNRLVPYQKDIVYATNMGMSSDFASTNGRVPLTFKHALVQIEIKAKNTNSAYKVKVKGYRIYGLWDYYNFPYPVPTTANSVTASMGNRSGDIGNTGGYPACYYSGWKNGFTTTEVNNGLSDTDDANYILLGEEAKTINNGVDAGLAMVLPKGKQAWNINSATGGFAIELLVQIDHNDAYSSPLYPACQQGSMSKRISYSGLPKYYGYVYFPYQTDGGSLNFANCAGKKVTFLVDFSSGLGTVDNTGLLEYMKGTRSPVTVDATDSSYNAADGTGSAGGTDPYTFNSAVLGSGFSTITATVGDWGTTEKQELNL